jgi:hypothetical protein
MSCDIGSVAVAFIDPSTSGIESARQELNAASAELAKTPPTLQEDIMDTWNYDKTVLSRSARGQLRLRLESTQGGTPTVAVIPVTHDWEDYQVTADPQHNVKGHEPASGPIDRPDTLLEPLGNKLRAPLAAQLQAAIVNASLEAAKKAFVAAGKAESKPGFEVVDAVAHQIAGNRISKLLLRGKSAARSKGKTALPAGNISLGPTDCVLAVATVPLDESGWTELSMASTSRSHFDTRGRPVVSFELCGYEVTALPKVEVSSNKDTALLWGFYLTAGGNAEGLVAPMADAGIAETSPAPASVVAPAAVATPPAPAPAPPPPPQPTRIIPPRPDATAPPPVDAALQGDAGETCRARSDCKPGLRCMANVCTR